MGKARAEVTSGGDHFRVSFISTYPDFLPLMERKGICTWCATDLLLATDCQGNVSGWDAVCQAAHNKEQHALNGNTMWAHAVANTRANAWASKTQGVRNGGIRGVAAPAYELRHFNRDNREAFLARIAGMNADREAAYQQELGEWREALIAWRDAGPNGEVDHPGNEPRRQPDLREFEVAREGADAEVGEAGWMDMVRGLLRMRNVDPAAAGTLPALLALHFPDNHEDIGVGSMASRGEGFDIAREQGQQLNAGTAVLDG